MTCLDRNKPFGEVFGGGLNIKYQYEQNNKYFNAQGEEVDKNGDKNEPERNETVAPQAASKPKPTNRRQQ